MSNRELAERIHDIADYEGFLGVELDLIISDMPENTLKSIDNI